MEDILEILATLKNLTPGIHLYRQMLLNSKIRDRIAMSPLGRKFNVDFVDERNDDARLYDIGYNGYNQRNVFYNSKKQQKAPQRRDSKFGRMTLRNILKVVKLLKMMMKSEEVKWGIW